ncbi:conserved membrane hypothetical protein [uncultured Desulfatiglans sp.]|nr:conserved membrane hypothetical protein [uncultured Desulfatiglans sp.]
MDPIPVKFGEWFEKGFALYKQNIVPLILASLIALVLGTATLGILAGPMLAGLFLMVLAFHDGREPRPDVGEIFRGFNFFLNSLLFVGVWGIAMLMLAVIVGLIPCVGQLAALFGVYAMQTFLMFGLLLIVDRGMDFWQASQESYQAVKTNFWQFLGLMIVTGIIGSLGAIACGLGLAVTVPIQICILTVAYRDIFKEGEAETAEVIEIIETGPAPEPHPENPA